jgi:hypothetical protein
MHVENEFVEYVTLGDQEYEEIIEEYEEEILKPQEVQELPMTDFVDTAPAQGKPRCITLIFYIIIYICCCAFTLQEFYRTHMHIYIYPMSPTSLGSIAAMLRLSVAWVTFYYSKVGGYYDSH